MMTENPSSCCSVVPCDDGLAERPRYYPRQLITPDDMTLEQEYFRNRMRRHNRLLHGWGVVCGTLVCPVFRSNGSTVGVPWKVVIQPGFILGPYGDEIIIDCNVCLDLRTRCVTGVSGEACGGSVDPWCSEVYEPPAVDAPLYVAVRYKEVMTRPVRVQPVGCGCDDNQCEYSRWRDGYEICVLDHCPESKDAPPTVDLPKGGHAPGCSPCPTEPWIVLAEVRLDAQGTVERIDNCVCRRLAVSLGNLWWKCTAEMPEIDGVEPRALEPGKDVGVAIAGKHLDPAAEVSFGSGVAVTSVTESKGRLMAMVTVDANAQEGPRNVVVKNPDCSTATLSGGVNVGATETLPAPSKEPAPRARRARRRRP